MRPYIISQDKSSGAWYCHKAGFIRIPVSGSIGDKSKARAVCNMMNKTLLDVDIKEDKSAGS